MATKILEIPPGPGWLPVGNLCPNNQLREKLLLMFYRSLRMNLQLLILDYSWRPQKTKKIL